MFKTNANFNSSTQTYKVNEESSDQYFNSTYHNKKAENCFPNSYLASPFNYKSSIANTNLYTHLDFEKAYINTSSQINQDFRNSNYSYHKYNNIYNTSNCQQGNMSITRPTVTIIEQPAKCALRFRYECEGRSAGSLPGASSTFESKTFPSIQIQNYLGRAVIVISCVTKDQPFKPHPHNIVGKEGCKKGICTVVMNNEANMVRSFPNLGIQCVRRRDIDASLTQRESIKVDPFRTGFSHKKAASGIDLNVVRLCFQVFIEAPGTNRCDVPLAPIVSDPIHDKKAMSDLVITKLSHCSAPACGGREVILLCDRISKDDIKIRFYEEKNGKVIWEAYSDFSPADIHKQVAICFKTPKYYDENIQQPVRVNVQLQRISDNQVSESRMFQFLPSESEDDYISRKRQKVGNFDFDSYVMGKIPHLRQQRQQQLEQDRYNAFMEAQKQIPQQSVVGLYSNPGEPGPSYAMQKNLGQHLQQPQAPDLSRISPIEGQFHNAYNNTQPLYDDYHVETRNQANQQQQQQFYEKDQELIVRHQIIDEKGKVTRVIEDQQQENTNEQKQQIKLDTLDRIHTNELMSAINFNSNLELNLASTLSLNLGVSPNDMNTEQQQRGSEQKNFTTNTSQSSSASKSKRDNENKFNSYNTLNTPQVSELDPKPVN